jgi:ankyrin repeat protein
MRSTLLATGSAAIATAFSRVAAAPLAPSSAHAFSAGQAAAAVVAARRGDAAALRRLLAEGCVPDAYDGEGWTPLLAACARGHADIVALLLGNQPAARIDLAHRDSGGLPIHFAGQSGNAAVAELLLVRQPDQLDAVWYVNGHTLARLLLDHGADPLRCERHPTAVDAVIRASVFNHLDVLTLIADRLPAQALAEALNRPASVNGLTALHDTVLRAPPRPRPARGRDTTLIFHTRKSAWAGLAMAAW